MSVPPINSGIPHKFVPKSEGHEGGPAYCIAPCHGHKSAAYHISADALADLLTAALRASVDRARAAAGKPPVTAQYYLASETDPRIRIFAGSSEEGARIRLMHAQHNNPYARYYITTEGV